jgi:hypothetical protein
MMAQAPAKAQGFLHPEYSIYVYHLPENQHEGQSDWEKRSVFSSSAAAFQEAYRLFETRKFKRVEIKQRQHNLYTQAVQAKTVKVLDLRAHKKAALFWLAAFCGVVGVCLAGYWF